MNVNGMLAGGESFDVEFDFTFREPLRKELRLPTDLAFRRFLNSATTDFAAACAVRFLRNGLSGRRKTGDDSAIVLNF